MNDVLLAAANLAGGAVISLGSYLMGIAVGHRERLPFDPDDADQYICGCGHHLSDHDPDGAHRCRHVEYDTYISDRNAHGAIWSPLEEPCTCQQYVGPIPPDLLLAQLEQRQKDKLPQLPTPPGEDPRERAQPATAFDRERSDT